MGCGPAKQEKQLVVRNPADFDRTELASIPYQTFREHFPGNTAFRIIDPGSGKEVPYQLEKKGGDSIQNLLIWVSVRANDSLLLKVMAGQPDSIAPKTFARYVPERYDDFAWENDKIAFRMYGKALESRPDNAEGTDIWAKRTDKLIIDKWYKEADYHKDHGEGLDYYNVGMTLGAGDIAPVVDGKIVFSKHYRQHEVLDNGPLRSTFKLTYEPFQVNGQSVEVSKTISLDAGSQLNRVEVVYKLEKEDTLAVAAGIVLRKEEGQKISYPEAGITAYWEPAHGEDGHLGVAVLSKDPVRAVREVDGQLLTQYRASSGQPLVYYNGGVWDKAGEIKDAKAWRSYLKQFKMRLEQPLNVSIK